MSTQIVVRLPDTLVAEVDRLVGAGHVRSRASWVEAALERELRRLAAERDAEILRDAGPDDDLDQPGLISLDDAVTIPTRLLGRTIGVLSAEQERQLAVSVALAYDLDVRLFSE